MKQFFSSAEIRDWEMIGPGIRRKILAYDNQLMMVYVEFEKGAVGSKHKHSHRQATFIEDGIFEVQIGEKKQLLRKGDAFFVAPDIDHSVVALEDGCLIDAFAPARKDFLKNT